MRRTLDGPTIVGRSLDCAISLEDGRLSRQHCRIEATPDDGWAVVDLQSTNGTFIAGQKISFHKLADGDEVHVGRSRIVFHARSTPPVRPEQPTRSAPSDSMAAPSPADTLADSRFRIPRVDPGSVSAMKTASPAHEDAAKSSPSARRTPLPFQRPPAKPIVPRDHQKPGMLRSLWKRLVGRDESRR